MSSILVFLINLLYGGESYIMAIVYATLIIKGVKTLEQVPALIKSQVEGILADLEITA